MVLKAVNGLLVAIALAALCTGCGEREKREAKEMAAPPAGCCQQADNTCAGPVTETECSQMNGTWTEGGACQTDGMCGPQPQ